MRLDLNGLQVESFEPAEPIDDDVAEPVKDTVYAPCPVRETIFYPCTQAHQLTCVGCA
jgi:hypothetical protein